MLNIYDLYDLYAIFISIRTFPEYELNGEVLLKVIGVLKNRHKNHSINQFRIALRSIESLDKNKFYFVYVDNIYVYFSSFLKDKTVYKILIACCECLFHAVKSKNVEKIRDLADCLHNLPILIANNNLTIPISFWQQEAKFYRDKWDKNFLKHDDLQ